MNKAKVMNNVLWNQNQCIIVIWLGELINPTIEFENCFELDFEVDNILFHFIFLKQVRLLF